MNVADAAEKRKRTMDREDVKKIILENIEKKNREQMRTLFASVGQEEGPRDRPRKTSSA